VDTQTTKLVNEGNMLPLMEEFYTIQGEGYHTGTAAYFIRIGGCDVGCHWCDVKESWNANLHPPTLTSTIVENTKKYAKIAVITGGEPLMWDMSRITTLLQSQQIKTHIETSGAYKLTGEWDWICLSPKKMKLPNEEVHKNADELKMIVFNKSDFKFAEEQAAKVNSNCELFLQAEWSNRSKMTPLIVAYVLKNPQWKISIQTHKYLNVP
jgi:7-carboxy-7-deazaguanine synthase